MGLRSPLLLLTLSLTMLLVLRNARAQVPYIFVFGDSTADVGNNNYLPPDVDAKANYPHYGIDYPSSEATGRFSNAYNGIDYVAINMGFRKSPPPYLSLLEQNSFQILRRYRGVNFASAGSGILNSTGNSISMAKQIEYFSTFRSNLIKTLGTRRTNLFLSETIFIISSGNNDIFAYFMKKPSANDTKQFITTLVSNYADRLQSLYKLGARKFALIDVPPIGCCPLARSLDPWASCIGGLNDMAQAFNNAAKLLLSKLSSTQARMKYSIGSSFAVVSKIIAKPEELGFEEITNACCGTGRLNAATLCIPTAHYCSDRSKYLFWDKLHPTDATSKVAGLAFYNGSLEFASPINFRQLVAAKSSDAVSYGDLENDEGFASA